MQTATSSSVTHGFQFAKRFLHQVVNCFAKLTDERAFGSFAR